MEKKLIEEWLKVDNASGDGSGFGSGSGYGDGSGFGDGFGSGSASGDGISKYNNHYVFIIDNISTIITSIHGNVAKGFILNKDLTLEKIFVVKGNNKFAHGKTLKEAVADLQEKIFDDLDIEEKIEMFNKQFNRVEKCSGEEFYKWHHILTGSCTAGRDNFVRENNLDLKKLYTVDEFIKITKDSYGGNIIKKLCEEE